MTTVSNTHKSDSLWVKIKIAVAKANDERRDRNIAIWSGENTPAAHWRADGMYRLIRNVYALNSDEQTCR